MLKLICRFSLFVIPLVWISGCACGGFGTGIDCTIIGEEIILSIDRDETKAGFSESELDSIYIVAFVPDSVSPFAYPADTILLAHASRDYNATDSKRMFVRMPDTGDGKNYIIANKLGSPEYRITDIKKQIIGNTSKCCSGYTAETKVSYVLNGVEKSVKDPVLISKK
jgi:hypothetical protein